MISYTAKDLDFDIGRQLTKRIQWEIWDKIAKDSLSNTKVNPIQVDTLCEYIKLLVPPTLGAEIKCTPYGCILNMDNDHIFVIITPDDITVKSFEKLPSSSFMFDIFKYTGKHTNNSENEWEYHFELLEILQ